MNQDELLKIINSGETSKAQFKQILDNDDSIAAEMIAMSNSKGGIIIFGVNDKNGEIIGLDYAQLQSFNNRLATLANDRVKPQIFILTETVSIQKDNAEKKVLVVSISEGVAKPYKDKDGAIWIKQGSDKRRLLDNNEQIRLFAQSGIIYVDEMIVGQASKSDLNIEKVKDYIRRIKKDDIEDEIVITDALLENLTIVKDNKLTLAGLLFFGKTPQKYRQAFCIKAISFFGNSIGGDSYRDSKDIVGTIPDMFEQGMNFLKSNLHQVQNGQNFNSVGRLEISETALEEVLQNALVHRDYSKNASIKIMIFDNRVEIVSPGSLPNSLTVENIKLGNAVVRNNLLATYCYKTMRYRGFGSGIVRSIEKQSNIEFINDVSGEQFIVRIPRVSQY
jgi:predicted HTH transcriptional regulator